MPRPKGANRAIKLSDLLGSGDPEDLPLPPQDSGEDEEAEEAEESVESENAGEIGEAESAESNSATGAGKSRSRERPRPSAYDAAMRILAAGDNSRRMLAEKLSRKGYPPAQISAALSALEENGYVSDARLMARYAESLARGKFYGAYRIRLEIARRFDRDSVDRYLAASLAPIDFAANAAAFAKKFAPRGRDYLIRRLHALGYTGPEIRDALGRRT